MDRLRNVAKGGWHPSGDKQIHRETWKSDLKGIATGKKTDPYADAQEHQSRPLSSLKDPDSFGPPPRRGDTSASVPRSGNAGFTPARSGLNSSVPSPAPRNTQPEVEEETQAPPPPLPYRVNTTGLRTDNLPAPPVRRTETSGSPRQTASPMLPPRQPARATQPQSVRTPFLPPRQNEYPDEYTPPAPPPYNEAIQPNQSNPALINQEAASRLSRAGISVPGFGIGSSTNNDSRPLPVQASQVSELQQRFARMNAGSSAASTPDSFNATPSTQKKAPPAPPPKKANLASPSQTIGNDFNDPPPPLPLGSKPRPAWE